MEDPHTDHSGRNAVPFTVFNGVGFQTNLDMMTRTGMTKIGCSFLPDPENTSTQESGRQERALCVAGLLSQIVLCVSTTGDRIIQSRT